jgi:hypothetical protein
VKELCGTDSSEEKEQALDLGERAMRAMNSLRAQASSFQRQMEEQSSLSSELLWLRKRTEIELASAMKEMDLEAVMVRGKVVEAFGKKFREALPESALTKMKRAEDSPGELLMQLAEKMSENEILFEDVTKLEREVTEQEILIERLRIAHSNADAGAQLSLFEINALDASLLSNVNIRNVSISKSILRDEWR